MTIGPRRQLRPAAHWPPNLRRRTAFRPYCYPPASPASAFPSGGGRRPHPPPVAAQTSAARWWKRSRRTCRRATAPTRASTAARTSPTTTSSSPRWVHDLTTLTLTKNSLQMTCCVFSWQLRFWLPTCFLKLFLVQIVEILLKLRHIYMQVQSIIIK